MTDLPLTCEEYSSVETIFLENDADFKWIKGNTKQCPNCRFYVEKNGGCYHMSCRCHNTWNYLSRPSPTPEFDLFLDFSNFSQIMNDLEASKNAFMCKKCTSQQAQCQIASNFLHFSAIKLFLLSSDKTGKAKTVNVSEIHKELNVIKTELAACSMNANSQIFSSRFKKVHDHISLVKSLFKQYLQSIFNNYLV